jgi:hypothetical protein
MLLIRIDALGADSSGKSRAVFVVFQAEEAGTPF